MDRYIYNPRVSRVEAREESAPQLGTSTTQEFLELRRVKNPLHNFLDDMVNRPISSQWSRVLFANFMLSNSSRRTGDPAPALLKSGFNHLPFLITRDSQIGTGRFVSRGADSFRQSRRSYHRKELRPSARHFATHESRPANRGRVATRVLRSML